MKRRIFSMIFGAIAAAAPLLIADAGLRIWAAYSNEPTLRATLSPSYRPDPVLGWSFPPDVVVRHLKMLDGARIASASYSIDHFSRRVTPGQGTDPRRPLLFFGCSFTFGESLQDDQTLPYHFSRLAPAFRVYNYASMGWGPQNMLALLRETNIASQVPQRGRAIGVYVFIDDHIRRVAGSLSWISSQVLHLPNYDLSASGHLVRRGDFRSAHPLRTMLYKHLGDTALVKALGLDWPPPGDQGPLRMTALILKESKDAFMADFGSDEFYVLMYPGSQRAKDLIPLLTAYGVRYLDESKLGLPEPAYLEDGHPSEKSNKILARRIAKDLLDSERQG